MEKKRSLEILSLNERRITLYAEGYSLSLLNGVRRTVLSHVPTVAIDFAYFYDNNTGVPDEIIAHRLGLIVFDSNEAIKKYKSPEECKNADEKDSSCFVEIFLEKSLSDDADTGVYIKASDLIISDPDVKPVYPETPIVFLAPGQRIHMVAYARLGRGAEHGKWMPASVSIVQYLPRVEYDGSKASEECIKCVEAYPDLAEKLSRGEKGVIEYKRNINTSALRYCADSKDICGDAVKLYYDENRLLLTVETTGALRPEIIVAESINTLEVRVKKVLEAVKKAGVVERQ
ncbi:MAG: DNA-directed RNA polymerase subunit D [Desulfurococcales archaeon]|nr:DNA-directed RNA polymerase subunit D [Desulfurococcales archaeon]